MFDEKKFVCFFESEFPVDKFIEYFQWNHVIITHLILALSQAY